MEEIIVSAAVVPQYHRTIRTSKELARRLAEVAQLIRSHLSRALKVEFENEPLQKPHKEFQEASAQGMSPDDFADALAQTIAYNFLSTHLSRPVRVCTEQPPNALPAINLLQPLFITAGPEAELYKSSLNKFRELLNRTDIEAVLKDFSNRMPCEDPLLHFYELFLREYDPEKRMKHGVFYTPHSIVSFMVRSVDEILRAEFKLADGLADITSWGEMSALHEGLQIPPGVSKDAPFVQILDPATGTGAFLVEIIDAIHHTMRARWSTEHRTEHEMIELWNDYVPKHLLPRLHGFELMPVPHSIAHMKVALKLSETNYSLRPGERARIHLLNALDETANSSGYHAKAAQSQQPHLANPCKTDVPFTVIIGNPPYAVGSQNRSRFIRDLISVYKEDLGERKINLDDDFIKFMRLSEHMLEKVPAGVLAFISNNTYIDGLTHRRMRQHLQQTFRHIRIVDLHGDINKKASLPDGTPDQNIFDIEQGVAIGFFARLQTPDISSKSTVQYTDLWGSRREKFDALMKGSLESLDGWSGISPEAPNFLFVSLNESLRPEWESYFPLDHAMMNKSGFMTQRDEFITDFEAGALGQRLSSYFSSHLSGPELASVFGIHDFRNFAVERFRRGKKFEEEKIRKCLFRPFDWRFIYYDRAIVQQWQYDILRHLFSPNIALIFMRQVVQRNAAYSHFLVTRDIADHRAMRSNRGHANLAPLYLYSQDNEQSTSAQACEIRRANFTEPFLAAFTSRSGLSYKADGPCDLTSTIGPSDILHYIYAIFHSEVYRSRYAEFLKREFPRIPLTSKPELVRQLCALGADLIALHLLEDDYEAASWNSSQPASHNPLGHSHTKFTGGEATIARGYPKYRDSCIHINAQSCFTGVSEGVWRFHIGGYAVCRKWLKDRRGRTLTREEITHYRRIMAALDETILLMHRIDRAIETEGGWPL